MLLSAAQIEILYSPQPFKVSEVVAGGRPKPSDRIFVDESGFLANVLVEVRVALLEISGNPNPDHSP